MWAAYGLGLILAIQPDDSSGIRLAVIAGLFLGFLVTSRFNLGWWGVVGLVVAGIALRVSVDTRLASDVLDVTGAALRQVYLGLNPYGHGYDISRPPGAPFPYGPVALLWYSPAIGNPRELELFVSCLVIAMFAVRGRPVGLAAYAMAPTVLLTAVDGSNDTSAGFLLLLALIVAAKRPRLGGVMLAIAVGFKPYALAWTPALFAYGGLGSVVGFGLTSAAIWLPTFWLWGLGNYLVSLHGADLAHRAAYWSVGVIYESLTQQLAPHALLDQIRLVVAGAVTVVGLWVAKSIDRVIVVGTVIFVIMMFGGFWGSYAYLGAIAPVICWRLDDWLRVPAPAFVKDKPWAPALSPAMASGSALGEGPAAGAQGSDGLPDPEPGAIDPTEPIPAPDGTQPAPAPAPAWSTRTVARS
jgi:hypothetical protein